MSPYALLVVSMGLATVLEKLHGREYAYQAIYGTWWFTALWAVAVLLSVGYLLQRKALRRFSVLLLHLSFVVILLGALLTRLTSEEGTLHLREGETASAFTDKHGASRPLPFSLSLSDFEEIPYPGTDATMDYHAHVVVEREGHREEQCISMNHIGKAGGYRFYQSSCDTDGRGTHLLVTSDPWGIAVTYTGYLLLLAGLLLTLFSRRTRIRRLLHQAMRPALSLLLVLTGTTQAGAAGVDRETADEIGQLAVLYNGRICPLNTAATDFVTKLCGKSTWQGMSANEIFVGWTIFYTEWEKRPLIKVKDREVQRMLGIEGQWACVRDFYTAQHEYKLSGKADDASLPEKTRKAVRETDEKIQVITMFYHSEMLRIFPLPEQGRLVWHKPGSTELPQGVGEAEFQFINHAMDHLVKCILAHDVQGTRQLVAKIRPYQQEKAGDVLPSPAALRAETLYNTLQGARWVVYACVALSLLFCWMFFTVKPGRWLHHCHTAFLLLLATYVSVLAVLRWWVSGHVPLGNGYETMLFMAWASLLLTLMLSRPFPVLKAFGPVAASLCLLVATLAGGTPQVTPLMPVLQSPLLTLHVALVMMAYTLIAVITLLALRCLSLRRKVAERERLTALSQFLLYPAVSLLALGIFTGAVWANVSWGTYWSWDPKETWALITLLAYALPLHGSLQTSPHYHHYTLLAFLAVLMTYFGVNYFLSGMHSYN